MNIKEVVIEPIYKLFRAGQNAYYEAGLNRYQGDKYDLTTLQISNYFSFRTSPFNVDLRKLAYYTEHQMIPAPKRVGINSFLGGSIGKYKYKTSLMLWYIGELKKRGIKSQDELRLHIYNYFHTENLPPKPVSDTPFAERYIYTWRISKITPVLLPEFEDFNIYMENEEPIPAKKATYYFEGKPFDQILFFERNLTEKENEFLKILRKNKEFLSASGIKTYILNSKEEVEQKDIMDLFVFKDYPIVSDDDDKKSYRDLLNKKYTFQNI